MKIFIKIFLFTIYQHISLSGGIFGTTFRQRLKINLKEKKWQYQS